jgi:2-oxo-4-hydroxy-4-carboxy-5-ureidoimidazoline decarboxylase
VRIVEESGEERQVALIAAHPDLAGRAAREGRLTASSTDEQRSAGLDRLTAEEFARFDRLNTAYSATFGFPFVICAREHNKESILATLDARLQNDRRTEIHTALREIAKIAQLRLDEAISQ